MSQITITKASIHDLETIQLIATETFAETFAESNTEDDLNNYLKTHFTREQIGSELTNPDSLFFIAWDQADPVGYLKLNSGPAQTELKDAVSMEIERIYVKGSYHGKKVGQLLYETALETALLHRKSYIWLGVWEENPKAIRFYEKNGFVAFDKHLFRMGEDEQTDIMMKKVLSYF